MEKALVDIIIYFGNTLNSIAEIVDALLCIVCAIYYCLIMRNYVTIILKKREMP